MSAPPDKSLTAPIQRRSHDTTTQCATLASSSLTTGSSPLQDGKKHGTSFKIPSSPPSVSSNSRYLSPHRRTISNSEYFYRDQPSDQQSLEITSNPILSSRALSRIEQRRRIGLSTPEPAFTSSPTLVRFAQLEKQSRSFREPTLNGKAQSLRKPDYSEITTPKVSMLKFGRTRLMRNSRTKVKAALLDEWEEAGTSETKRTSSRRSSDASKSQRALIFKSKVDSSDREPDTFSYAARPSIDETVSQYDGESKGSSGETTSRASFEKSHGNGIFCSRRKFSDSIRDARTSRQSKVLDYQPARSVFSDNSGSVLGFIEPRVSPKLLGNVLPHEQSGSFVNSIQPHDLALKHHSLGTSPHAEVASPQNTVKPALVSTRISSHQYNGVDSLSLPPSEGTFQNLIKSRDARMISQDSARSEQGTGSIKTTDIGLEEPAILKNSLSLSQISTCASQLPILSNPYLSPRPSTAPKVFTHSLSFTSPFVLFEQTPQYPNELSTLMLPVETFSQRPVHPSPRLGLSFAEASAIIYCLVAYTALWLLISGAGTDVYVADIVSRMGVTFSIGAIFCIFLHWSVSGSIAQIPGNFLRSIQIPVLCVAIVWGVWSITERIGWWNNI